MLQLRELRMRCESGSLPYRRYVAQASYRFIYDSCADVLYVGNSIQSRSHVVFSLLHPRWPGPLIRGSLEDRPAPAAEYADAAYEKSASLIKFTWLALAEDHAALSRSLEQLMALSEVCKGEEGTSGIARGKISG